MSCDDMWMENEVERTTHHRARKSHRCYGCSNTIHPGHRYRRCFLIADGRPESFRYCGRCALLIDAITSRGEGFVHGFDCGHSWEDVFGGEPPEEVTRLAFMTDEEAQQALAGGDGHA